MPNANKQIETIKKLCDSSLLRASLQSEHGKQTLFLGRSGHKDDLVIFKTQNLRIS